MLNKITITNPLTLGELAELLLFYDSVHLLCGESTIRAILKQASPSVLIPFLEEHRECIAVDYALSSVCISGGYDSVPIVSVMHERQITSEPDFIEYILTTGALDCADGFIKDHNLARRLVSLMGYHTVDSTLFKDAFSGQNGLHDLTNFLSSYVRNDAARSRLNALVQRLRIEPNIGSYSIVAEEPTREALASGVFYDALIAYAESINCIGALTDAGGHIRASEGVSLALTSKLSSTISRSSRAGIDRSDFVQYAFQSARDIRAMLDNGEMSFREFIQIYEEGKKFRSWIKDLPDDSQLLTEYLQTLNSIPALARLPAKTVRWTLFTGAGLAADALLGGGGMGTLAASGVSVLDTFLIDKLLGKWKPNQYISRVDALLAAQS